MKKLFAGIMAAVMMAASLTACGGASSPAASTAGSAAGTTGEKEKVVFWYSHQGDEATAFENAIAAYNASQDKYEVEGLSVTDKQKFIVALSGSEAPDAIEVSNQDIISYANNGLVEAITPYNEAAGIDVSSIFSNQALEANTIDGELYAMPLASMIIQMYYNKDILTELGYDAPPATMEELYEMAVAATEVDESGTITRVGYPLFPLASARQELTYAFGGRWWAEDGKTLTPNNAGTIASLNMNVAYRELYGINKVQEFVATANTNRYTENDMFFAGKQLFRFDGTWLSTMIKQFNSDVNYGVALIPGTKASPDTAGTSRYETNSIAIPIVANCKDGAYDFIQFMTAGDGTKNLLLDLGNLPTRIDLYEDADILAMPDWEIFIDALKTENGIQYATIADLSKYTSLIDEYLDYVYNGMMTPEEAMAELDTQAQALE